MRSPPKVGNLRYADWGWLYSTIVLRSVIPMLRLR